MNCYKHTGFGTVKILKTEHILRKLKPDCVHLQEIHLEDDTFKNTYMDSNYIIFKNIAANGYGTASLIANHIEVQDYLFDDDGKPQLIITKGMSVLNVYPMSGSDNPSKVIRERFFLWNNPSTKS